LGFIGFAGLVAAGLIVGLFFPDSRVAWDCLGTCVTILIHSGLMRLQLSGLRLKYPRWYVLVRVGWCVVSALLISAIIWWDNNWAKGQLIVATTAWWVGLIVSDPCARLLSLGWARVMSVTGLVASLALALVWSSKTFFLISYPYGDDLLYLALGFAAFAGVRLIALGPNDRRWSVHVPAWLLFACSLVAASLVWLEHDLSAELKIRVALATGFVAVISLLPATAALLTRRGARLEGVAGRRPRIDLICPRCKMNVEATTGASRCPSCATEFRIEVRSAACLSCGYSMTGIWPVCPECGSNHGA
jgi:hypothetical protein